MPNNEGNQPGGVEQHPVPPVVDRGGPAPATLIHATPPPDQAGIVTVEQLLFFHGYILCISIISPLAPHLRFEGGGVVCNPKVAILRPFHPIFM